MSIRIILADDHEVMREGLRALLFRQPDFEVVSCVSNGKEALDEARRTMPDVIIMDIRMPEMDGIQATQELLRDLPDAKVLCLSMHHNAACVRSALAAGASGYLVKDCALTEIVDAVRMIHKGRQYLSPEVQSSVKNSRY